MKRILHLVLVKIIILKSNNWFKIELLRLVRPLTDHEIIKLNVCIDSKIKNTALFLFGTEP